MDTANVELVGGHVIAPVPTYLAWERVDRKPLLRLLLQDSYGGTVATALLDFAAASETMIWLNENVDYTMLVDQNVQPRPLEPLRATMSETAKYVARDLRALRIACSNCPRDAEYLSWPDDASRVERPACPAHLWPNWRDLPDVTALQLAMLCLVADRPGSTTVDLSNRGAVDWTVQGTGLVLGRLKRADLVSSQQIGRHRIWYVTEAGRVISAHAQPPAVFGR